MARGLGFGGGHEGQVLNHFLGILRLAGAGLARAEDALVLSVCQHTNIAERIKLLSLPRGRLTVNMRNDQNFSNQRFYFGSLSGCHYLCYKQCKSVPKLQWIHGPVSKDYLHALDWQNLHCRDIRC